MQGRGSAKVRDFALYGETTGETDEFGLPVRYNWSADYRSKALVVYGHTPVPEPQWLNNTVNIDTGCVFGGRLTALRYPEREIVSVPAHATYYQSRKPFLPSEVLAECASQHVADDVLDIEDVTGKRIVDTRLQPRISIREENAMAALEVMSRFAVDPKWLIYLPPTMSPTETTRMPGHDGFIVPNCFEEFYERFPNYVATWVRKRVRGCVSATEAEDWTQELLNASLCSAKVLEVSQRRQEGCDSDVRPEAYAWSERSKVPRLHQSVSRKQIQ